MLLAKYLMIFRIFVGSVVRIANFRASASGLGTLRHLIRLRLSTYIESSCVGQTLTLAFVRFAETFCKPLNDLFNQHCYSITHCKRIVFVFVLSRKIFTLKLWL